MSNQNLTIDKLQEGDNITISVNGAVTFSNANTFRDALIPCFEENKHINIDLAKVPSMSSGGIRVILKGYQLSKSKGKTMTILNVSESVMHTLTISGFANQLTII